jgi:arylformamidase
MAGQLYDISQRLHTGIPVWPGDTAYSIERTWQLDTDCPVNVSRLGLSTHTGTHADAPFHYDPQGAGSADCDLQPYLGPATLLDLSSQVGSVVRVEHLEPLLQQPKERVLLRLFSNFPHQHWPSGFPAISAAAIEWLAARGCRLIGVDTPSLDPENSKTLDAHHAVRRAGMAILEGLVLDAVPVGDYELIALPLKIDNADASPVRAVLRSLDF